MLLSVNDDLLNTANLYITKMDVWRCHKKNNDIIKLNNRLIFIKKKKNIMKKAKALTAGLIAMSLLSVT
ncbi:hypothetical protein lacNasYZ03_06090 [Lactobacillus nasalidis]|uniref:Uncharacterized protein n=1 Tax=Lactobacillus nasalidis TaxID=2797258 RepID=A0ABQ3W9S8_9LACO|nr:hypothetical protein lacNasYZ03_06090 [Lactobacillus nasalidis]